MNTEESSSFLNHCGTVNRFIEWISVASLRFVPVELGPDLVIFILSVGGVLAAS